MSRTALIAMVVCFVGCGGESSTDGSSTGGTSGAGGAAGGAGGAGGGSGGSVGGAGGSGGSVGGAGGSGGSVGGAGGSVGGSGGSVGGAGGSVGGSGGSLGGSGGTGGGGSAKPECAADGDCKVFSDCCSCIGVPTGENPPSCPALCIQDKCSELGAPKTAACVAGRCVMGFDCDSSKVTCKMATPSCNPGQVPQVTSAGTCWTGACVPADECRSVKACGECTGNLVCAAYVTQLGMQNHCVDIPKACGTSFSCSCLGPSVCIAPYGTCADFSGQKGVSCSCPNC